MFIFFNHILFIIVRFGTTLKSQALLSVEYPFGVVSNGAPYSVASVASNPTVFITPASASTFTAATKFTLILADASSLGDPDVQGNYRHFLSNSLGGAGVATGSNLTFVATGGNTITYYASPGPIVSTGPHRYAWLLLTQPTTFTAPANLSTVGTSPSHWSVASYISSTGLSLVAASFFTVQNGNATGSVVATTAFSTSVAAATSTGGSMITSVTGSSSSSGSATSAAPISTSTPKSSASTLGQNIISLVSIVALLVGTTLV